MKWKMVDSTMFPFPVCSTSDFCCTEKMFKKLSLTLVEGTAYYAGDEKNFRRGKKTTWELTSNWSVILNFLVFSYVSNSAISSQSNQCSSFFSLRLMISPAVHTNKRLGSA